MNRYRSIAILFAAATSTGCTSPATKGGSHSLFSSEKGEEIHSSLDRQGAQVDRMDAEARALTRQIN